MKKIDHCKIVDSFYHHHNKITIILYLFLIVYYIYIYNVFTSLGISQYISTFMINTFHK